MKSHIRWYLTIWGSLTTSIILIKALLPNLIDKIWGWYPISLTLALLIMNMYEGSRFSEYVRKNHYDAWKEIPCLGKKRVISIFEIAPFIYAEDHLNDPIVSFLKRNCQRILIMDIGIVLHYPFLWLILQVWDDWKYLF